MLVKIGLHISLYEIFPPTLHNKSTSTLLAVWSYLLVSYSNLDWRKHSSDLCLHTVNSCTVRFRVISSSFSDWLENVLVLITGSKVLLSCLVLWRVSQSPFLWVIFLWSVIFNLYLSKGCPPMAMLQHQDYVFLWSFAVSQWIVSVAVPNGRRKFLNCHSLQCISWS